MTTDELKRLQRLTEADSLLVCETCGKCWPDDDAAESESCDCGRFKPRMEFASLNDVAKEAVKLAATLLRIGEILGPHLDRTLAMTVVCYMVQFTPDEARELKRLLGE